MSGPTDSRRVFITGIHGFTGVHLSRTLAHQGWEVFGSTGIDGNATKTVRAMDILDTASLANWIADVQPSHFVHLAALSHVVGDPLSFYKVNVLGTESLLEAVAKSGIAPAKVLVASSANVYGNSAKSPITEDTPVCPMNHYALSKAAMELMLLKWFQRFPLVVTRPFNYTGPGQSTAFLVPKIVQAFFERQASIRLGNLDVVRDLSDVGFVCEAYRRLLVSSHHSVTVNVCSGAPVHLLQLIEIMRSITGHTPYIEVDPSLVRKDEVKTLCGSPQRLFDAVGTIPSAAHRDILDNMYSALRMGPAAHGHAPV